MLRPIAPLEELVVDMPCSWPFGLVVSAAYFLLELVEPLLEVPNLLLLFSELYATAMARA